MPGDVRLIVGGQAWASWTSYDLDADYLTPADGWRVTARNPGSAQLAAVRPGTVVQVLIDSTPILMGTLERVESERTVGVGHVISLSGRDLAGALTDCSPGTSWTLRNMSLAAVARQALSELGVAATVVAAAEAQVPRKIIKAEPGESYWDCLERYAHKARLGLWMDPLGVLNIGRPNYLAAPVAEVVHAVAPGTAGGTNVLSCQYVDDISGRRSPVTTVGQSAGGGLFAAAATVTGVAIDATLGLVRPVLVDDGDVASVTEAVARGRWEVSRRQFEGRSLTVEVQGHLAKPGVPWSPGQMVAVRDEVHGIVGSWWLRSRQMSRSQQSGTRTTLQLHPPNLYLPAA